MTEPTHSRQENWEGWPFLSVADAAEFVSELLAMVEEAAGSAPYLWTKVTYEDRQYEMRSLEEFRETALGLDLADMHDLSAMVFWSSDDPRPVAASFTLEGGTYRRRTQLRVSGTKGTAVDGVNVGAAAAVSRWAERTGAEEEDAQPTRVPDPQPAWRRLLAHPYAVQIIGGVIAGVVVLVIAAVIFSQG